MNTRTRFFALVGWCVLTGSPAGAPLLWGQTVVIGRIVGDGRLLAGAAVTIDPGAVQTVATDSGRYRLVIPYSGIARVSVRAVGFYPASRRFVLAGGDTVLADFTLAPVPQTLDSITVKGHVVPSPGKMQGFEQRRREGFGRFYTRDFLAQRESSPLANVLRLTPNLQLVRRRETCGGGFAVATSRGGEGRAESWMACMAYAACYVPIFLDGALYWGPGMPGVSPPDIDQLRVIDLEGIEVYRSASELPLQYRVLRSTCGALLLWTRVGGH